MRIVFIYIYKLTSFYLYQGDVYL